MNNKKIKKYTLLVVIIMSIAAILTSLSMIYNIQSLYGGLSSSYMHKEKASNLLEKDFYKSKSFDEGLMRPLTYWLSTSVQSDDEKEGFSDGTGEYINYEEYLKHNPGAKSNEEYMEKKKSDARFQLKRLNNIKFIAYNKNTKEYYTNTSYENIDEYNKNVKGYINLKIKSTKNERFYYKDLNGKTAKNTEVESKLLSVVGPDEIEMLVTFPSQKPVFGDRIYDEYKEYTNAIESVIVLAYIFIIGTITLIISFILYKRIKYKALDREGKLLRIYNKIPIEITLIILGLFGWETINRLITRWNYGDYVYHFLRENFIFLLIFITTIYLFYKSSKSYDKKLDILKNSIIYKLFTTSNELGKEVKQSSENIKLIPKIILLTILLIIFITVGLMITYTTSYWYSPKVMLLLVVIIPSIALIVFTSYTVKQLAYIGEIIETTNKIKDGDINAKVEIKGENDITKLAQNINSIGEGLDIAIEKQVKSERMKSELITNVSHDLKTPLTSIMNYIQLINKEENVSPEHIKDYINVIDNKSKRLKVLIEDLFEASKASSGNIELNIEKIDLGQLLRQSIGEMEEKLLENNLDIKLSITEEKMYINADGRCMYRVLENLLSNISKYTLPNTRVYIDLYQHNNNVKLVMKNISAYELNFDPSEIVERFKRGDESRNTEGSGLGLSIARDLVNIQGGEFNIEIYGDLFKSILRFKSNYNE